MTETKNTKVLVFYKIYTNFDSNPNFEDSKYDDDG